MQRAPLQFGALCKFCSLALDGGELQMEITMRKIAHSNLDSNATGNLDPELSAVDRNLLVRASLRLFLRRNVPISRDELLRVAFYAEDPGSRAA